MSEQVVKPRLVAFEVTRRCRFHCRHCRAEACAVAEQELSTQQCQRVLASIADFHKAVVILTGGEPLERGDIFELLEYGRSRGLRMVMATCGYCFTPELAERLKQAGLLAVSISLDAASAENHDRFRQMQGAFDAAVGAAAAARAVGLRFQINTTVTKENLHEIRSIAALAERLGAYCFNPFILVPTGRGRQMSAEILEPAVYEQLLRDLALLRRQVGIEVRVTCGPQFARIVRMDGDKGSDSRLAGCMAAKGFAFISYRGDVQTCGFLPISAGNLIERDYDFASIWLQSPLLNVIRDPSQYKGRCGRCKYVRICGGCRARAYALSGDYLGEDPLCGYLPQERTGER